MRNQGINSFYVVRRITLMFAVTTALAGCAANIQITRVTRHWLPPCSFGTPVEVVNRGKVLPRPVVVLGKIFIEKSYGGWVGGSRDADIVRRLKIAACSLGAEGLIDVHIYAARNSFSSDTKRWASGLAVSFDEQLPDDKPIPFVIVIPRVTGPSLGQRETIRQYAQYELEKRGYFAMVYEDTLSISSLAQLTPTELRSVSGDLASQVMAIDYQLAAEGETDHTVRASLRGVQSRDVTWESEVHISPGERSADVDTNVVLTPNDTAIRRGVRKLISTLPRFVAAATPD